MLTGSTIRQAINQLVSRFRGLHTISLSAFALGFLATDGFFLLPSQAFPDID
jgi:hypothetical protein